jgi:hypothetical protein
MNLCLLSNREYTAFSNISKESNFLEEELLAVPGEKAITKENKNTYV